MTHLKDKKLMSSSDEDHVIWLKVPEQSWKAKLFQRLLKYLAVNNQAHLKWIKNYFQTLPRPV